MTWTAQCRDPTIVYAKIDLSVTGIAVAGDRPDGIIWRGLVVHAQADDQKSDPAGNSGSRIACGSIK